MRDIGFLNKLLTKVADIPYCMGAIQGIINKHAINDNERNVKFGLIKRNVYFGNKRRVGVHYVVIQCDEKDSAHLQRVLIKAQQVKGFANTTKYTQFGFVANLSEKRYVKILRQQNEYNATVKALPLYKVNKTAIGKALGTESDGTNFLEKINH